VGRDADPLTGPEAAGIALPPVCARGLRVIEVRVDVDEHAGNLRNETADCHGRAAWRTMAAVYLLPRMPPKPPTPPHSQGPRPRATPRRSGAVAPKTLPPHSDFWASRAVRMLTHTRAEWTAIGGTPMTARSIYVRFLIPIAALGPLAGTLGTLLFDGERTSLAGSYTVSASTALLAGVLEYGLNLGAIWVFAFLIERLAPAFRAHPGRIDALKLAAFGATPYWLGSVLAFVPKLAPVGVVLGLYSVRLYALGLPPLMRVPGERLSSYTLAVGAGGVVLVLLMSAVLLGVTS
jgi:hypothetical protein